MKRMDDSYLYQNANYGESMFKYLMTAERIDKQSDAFNDVVYSVKRQANPVLIKVLLSNNVELLMDAKGMSRAFKVFYAKDVKNKSNNRKVYIDCTGLISLQNGEYKCSKVSTLISYLITAMVYLLYYERSSSVTTNVTVAKLGAEAFVDLMLYILGYLKVPVTYDNNKEKMSFVLAEYFQICVMGRETIDGAYNLAQKIAGLDKKTCDYLHYTFTNAFDDGRGSIDDFIKKFAEVFLNQVDGAIVPKNRTPLTTDSVLQRWMYAFGSGTFLGLELFVPFSAILTDCYVGGFLNSQNTIEKVVDSKRIVNFTNELFKIGSEH